LISSPRAPTATVLPLIATPDPNISCPAPSEARRCVRCLHVAVKLPAKSRLKTCADPLPSRGAPTAAVSPLIATVTPESARLDQTDRFEIEGTNLARCVQPALGLPATLRVKMYAGPQAIGVRLEVDEGLELPTTTVSPLIATLKPNRNLL